MRIVRRSLNPRLELDGVERTAAAGTAVWTQDMWDDYNRADPQGRELLLRMWGTPRR